MGGKLHLTEEKRELTLKLARYILTTHSSVRHTSITFKVGKTLVQWYINKYLPLINPTMYEKILKIWQINYKDGTRKANNRQLVNKAKRKEKIKDYIFNEIIQSENGQVLLTNRGIGVALGLGSSTVCGLMKEIQIEKECDFVRIEQRERGILKFYYKLKDDVK